MKPIIKNFKWSPKFSAALLSLLLGISYFFVSYHHTVANLKSTQYSIFLDAKKEIENSLKQYQQFQILTEFRLLKSLTHQDHIPQILSWPTNPILFKDFPHIIEMSFLPSWDPLVQYSPLGKGTVTTKAQLDHGKDSMEYLGDGEFKIAKTLYDNNKLKFGVLQTRFSIKHLLLKYSPESEFRIYPLSQKFGKQDALIFQVAPFPYQFVSLRNFLSPWQYLWQFKVEIVSALIFGFTMFLVGISLAWLMRYKFLQKIKSRNHAFGKQVEALQEANQNLTNELLDSQNNLVLKEQSKKGMSSFFCELQGRYRQMASHAHSINQLTSTLILEDVGHNQNLQEIHTISQEGYRLTKQLASGYPSREAEENIDLTEFIEQTKEMYLAEIANRNIQIDFVCQISPQVCMDKVILRVIFCNIFNILMNRLINENKVSINISGEDPIEILFIDDGFDFGDKIQKIGNDRNLHNIFALDKESLEEFITAQGWEISFTRTHASKNAIRLTLFKSLPEAELPKNVVNLFDYKQTR